MDVLVHWRSTWRWPVTTDRFDNIEAITCDGQTVALIQEDDAFRFPLRWVAEFQVLDEDL